MLNLKSALAVAATAGAVALTVSAAHTLHRDTASDAPGSAARTAPATRSAGPTSGRPAQSVDQAIDWEHIINGGVETSVEAAHDRGRLAFEPIPPRFSVHPDKVLVSDPTRFAAEERAVSYLMHFPTSPTFPAPRTTVVVIEAPSQLSVADFVTGAKSNAARFRDGYKLVHYGAIPAELISAHGIGRIHTIIRGVGIDITGPAVSPAAVKELGRQLTAGLG